MNLQLCCYNEKLRLRKMLRERSFGFHIDAVMLTYPSIVGTIPCPAPLGIGVHLICFAHLRLWAGGTLFMGVFPSLPPAYYCALNIDTLSRGTATRLCRRVRPPKTLRCSAGTRAIRARTRGAVFAGNEYALFLANCPLCFFVGRGLAPAVLHRHAVV